MPRSWFVLAGALLLAAPSLPAQGVAAVAGEAHPQALLINILEGEGALNDVRARTAREPVVQVTDENHRPVAGAIVLFVIDSNGSGGLGATFSGAQAFSMSTDAAGRAVGRGFQLTRTTGKFHISVEAHSGTAHASAVIHETNLLQISHIALVNQLATLTASKSSLLIVLDAAALGAVTGVVIATAPPSPVGVTVGSGTVGPPVTAGVRITLGRHSR